MKQLACVTIDMEPDYGDPAKKIRLLEDPRHFERFVALINKYNARVTMFTVTSLLSTHGDLLQKLAGRIPLEFMVHSHTHDPLNACSLEEIQNSQAAYEKFVGKKPIGYRAPIGRINREGFKHLIDHGFSYDASVYPSARPGKFGYFNLHMPNVPFKISRSDGASLVEFPFTSIETIRIVYALSYAKLFGWKVYSLLLKLFGLPKIALLLAHPYDFYFGNIQNSTVDGIEWKALARSTGKEFETFENMLANLQSQGYEFTLLGDIYNEIHGMDMKTYALESWK